MEQHEETTSEEMDDEMDDEMVDEMEPKHTYNHDAGGGYSFTTKLFEGEEDVTEIRGEIKSAGNIIGSMDGYLISRGFGLNFFSSCDAVSAELQLLSNVLFHQTGRLNKFQWHKEFTIDVLMRSSKGNFLNIDIVRVEKEHRSKDLGFKYLQHLFEALEGQWTISVIVPGLERSKLEGEAKAIRSNHVCQLFARCGYKFLPIESKEPYWYLLPNEVKQLSKNEVKDVKDITLTNEHWSEYKNKLHSIHSMACFEEALVIGYEGFRKRPADLAKAVAKYEECKTLMPSDVKSLLVEGLVAPRMFKLLTSTADRQTEYTRMEIEDGDFQPRTPKSVEDLWMVQLLQYIPKEITRNGVYKTFLSGLLQVLETISTIMSAQKNRLPTTNRVMALLHHASWPPSYRQFFEKGGRIEHLLRGIIELSKEQSWAYGDGSYDEEAYDCGFEDEKLPLVEILDNDFHYVETFVLKHLLEN